MQNISYPIDFFRPFSFTEEMNNHNLFELDFDSSIIELPESLQKNLFKEDLFKFVEKPTENKKEATTSRRKEQTAMAARKYRKNKKKQLEALESTVKNLETENDQLSKDLSETNRKIELLLLSNLLLKNRFTT